MSKNQKTVLYVAAGALALYLLYRWYSSNQQSAGTSTTTPDTSATDYATLAGQEQSDAAALQQQNAQLNSQETSDVASLQGSIGSVASQETSDVSGLTGAIGSLTSTVSNLTAPDLSPIENQIAALATGVQKVDRTQYVNTHKGGAFYNYYTKVTGKPPPARLSASDFVYQSWKSGVNLLKLQKTPTHPSAPKQTQIAHPNANHTQQSNVAAKLPKPKATAKASKPKASGKRK